MVLFFLVGFFFYFSFVIILFTKNFIATNVKFYILRSGIMIGDHRVCVCVSVSVGVCVFVLVCIFI